MRTVARESEPCVRIAERAFERHAALYPLTHYTGILSLHGLARRALSELPAGARPLHHSDRGCQYCSHEYVGSLQAAGLEISMTEDLHCYENALAERVNGIIKQEYYLGTEFRAKTQALKAIAEAILLYNTRRPHTASNYRTPEEVHRAAARKIFCPPRGGQKALPVGAKP